MTIQIAGMNRVLQKFNIRVAENKFEPQYSLTAESKLFSKDKDTSFKNSFKPDLNVSPSVGLKTSLGTGLGISLPQTISNKGKHSIGARFTVSQPLLKGFGRDMTLLDLRNTYDNEVINRLQFRNKVSRTVVDIAKKYRALIQNNYNIEASRRSLEEAKKGVETTQAKIKAGRVASTEIIQSQAQYERLQLQYYKQTNDANISRQDLLTEIGLDPNAQIFVPKNIEVSTDDIPSLEESIQLALNNNFEYRSQINSMTQTRRSLDRAKNNMLWDLSLDYTADFGTGSIGNRLNSLNQTVSAKLTIPINDYGLKSSLINAKIKLKEGELSLAQARRKLIADIKKQIFDLNNLRTQIKFAERSLQLAEKSYFIENKKLQIGKSSSLNVSTAQDNVLKAKTDLIQAKISFENSLDALHISLGTALVKWGIELEY
jgi:outer membrane protein TolC